MNKSLTELFEDLNQVIQSHNSILIITHKNPDGDGIGSILALYWYLNSVGKKVTLGCIDKVPAMLSFLPGSRLIKQDFNCYDHDLVITVDAGNNILRLGVPDDLVPSTVNIDHHAGDSADFGRLNIIDPDRASSSEIILDIFVFLDYQLTKEVATCLLTGIFTDTNGFQNANTSHRVLEAAAKLMLKGANLRKIAFNTFRNKSISTLKIWGRALARVQKDSKTGMVVSTVTKQDLEECDASLEDLTGLSSIISTVSDSKFALLLTEYDINRVKASLRSEEHKGVDVSAIARMFKGGGHKLASGFEIQANIDETISLINNRINELGNENLILS